MGNEQDNSPEIGSSGAAGNQEASADARLQFSMSQDGMELGVKSYTPPKGQGRFLSEELVSELLLSANISLPPDPKAVDELLMAAATGDSVRGIVLVRGRPAREPRDGALNPRGDLSYPVFPGSIVATLIPPQTAKAGETIDGRTLEPQKKHKPKDFKFEAAGACLYDDYQSAFISEVFGLAEINKGVVKVEPLLHISKDEIRVTGSVHHRDNKGREITTERLAKVLEDMGIELHILEHGVKRALALARESNLLQAGVTLVKGREPVKGEDGWLEYMVQQRDAVGAKKEDGSIDYKDRGVYPLTKAGTPIVKVHPPTRGVGGIDVYNKTIPASEGKSLFLVPGENVREMEDGTLFEALEDGLVVVAKNIVSVTECLVIPGDISLATGNVKTKKGSLKVRGSVQSGFTVLIPKHVTVDDVVESAKITAGGNVAVGGGILMPEGGLIKAGGEITAQFATNANILCKGNVTISNNVTNCKIQTHGKFIAVRGNGIIQGGIVLASQGIEVNEVGSELGVKTVVAIAVQQAQNKALLEERAKLKDEIKEIDKILGNKPPRTILMQTPPEKRKEVAEMLKKRIAMLARHEMIGQEIIEAGKECYRKLSKIKIKVRRRIHSGSMVKMAGKTMIIKTPLDRCQFWWDNTEKEIKVGSL